MIKKLINDDLNEREKDGWSNLLMVLPYMFLQYDGSKPDMQRRAQFFTALQNEDVFDIKVGNFKKKMQKLSKTLDKNFDFLSRCHKEAD